MYRVRFQEQRPLACLRGRDVIDFRNNIFNDRFHEKRHVMRKVKSKDSWKNNPNTLSISLVRELKNLQVKPAFKFSCSRNTTASKC